VSAATTSDSGIRTEVADGVCRVTLDRPHVRNALSTLGRTALATTLRAADRDPDVRVVVVSGSGGHFCAGGDINEFVALSKVFGDRVSEIPVSATKAATGHLLGGTGALEAMFTVLAVQSRLAPPTINLVDQDPDIPFHASNQAQPLGDGPQLAISNSFGFGGHNAVVAIRSYN